jgi:hypothetical protein
MSSSRLAGTSRRRRAIEVALILTLVACVTLVLGPFAKAQARERAEREAHARALLDRATAAGQDFRRLAPAAVGIAYSAAQGDYFQVFEKMAPFELDELNEQLLSDPENTALLMRRSQAYNIVGDHLAELADLNRILELEPHSDWAREKRDEVLKRVGRSLEADRDGQLSAPAQKASSESTP